MIRLITEKEIEMACQLVWQVYQDEEKRTTPPYHSLEDVDKTLNKFYRHDSIEVLGLFENDTLEGIAIACLETDNNYLSINGPYIKLADLYDQLAGQALDYIQDKFRGFKCDVGTTKPNVNSQEFFKSRGFICTDDSIQMSIKPSELNEIRIEHDIELLTEERMDEYKDFHDTMFHDYYWLSDRIYKVMDQWKVHMLLDQSKIVGSVFTRGKKGGSGEIYGLSVLEPYNNVQVLKELCYVSTKAWVDEDIQEIVNFVPEGKMSQSAALVGYKAYDTYMNFSKEKL